VTCQHIRTHKVTYYDCTAVTCLTCGHKWREWPIAMTDAEYDSSLLILAAWYLQDPDRPAGRTLT
jgi:hypothetical protein